MNELNFIKHELKNESYKTDIILNLKENFNMTFTPMQAKILRETKNSSSEKYIEVSIKSCHGFGKTYTMAGFILDYISTMEDPLVITTAPCYDDQTEILTNNGWKFFKDLNKTEKVASLVDGYLEFIKPIDWMEYYVSGELLGFNGRDINFLVTPHHRCLVKGKYSKNWSIKKAEEIYNTTHYKFNRECLWYGKEDQYSEEHYELWGFWFADGYARYGGKNRRCEVILTQAKYKKYAKNLLKIYNLPIHTQKRKQDPKHTESFNFVIYNKELAKFFINFYDENKNKTIPQWLKESTPKKLKAFLKGFIMGDGCFSKTKKESTRVRVYKNEKLADDIQEIGIKAGYIVNKKKVKTDGWSLTFLSHQHKSKKTPSARTKRWYKQHYNGFVYCVKVPTKLGVVLVRRNGVYHWSGNTNRQLKDFLWKEIRRYGRNGASKYDLEILPDACVIRKQNEKIAIGFSTDHPEKFEGAHRKNVCVLVDEAKGLKEEIFNSIIGTIPNILLMISTPGASKGWFYKSFQKENIINYTINGEIWNEKRGERVPVHWLKYMEDTFGKENPVYLRKVKAEFATITESPYFNSEDIDHAIKNKIIPKPNSLHVLGIDWAKHQDYTALVEFKGRKCISIKTTQQDYMRTIAEVKKIHSEINPFNYIVADLGAGEGQIDRMKELRLPVEGFRFTRSSKTDIMSNLNLIFEERNIDLPNHDWMTEQLKSFEQIPLSDGEKYKLNAPEGTHDDIVDAMALAATKIRKKKFRKYLMR